MVRVLGDKQLIILDNLGGLKKGRLWINEMPNLREEIIDVIETTIEVSNRQQWEEKAVILELLLAPREISNYALLGVMYLPTNNEILNIKVNVSSFKGKILVDNIALSTDEVHLGIPKDYATSIINLVKEKVLEFQFPAGDLVFNVGAHGYVGSSKLIFSIITKVLMGLLGSKNIMKASIGELNEMVSDFLKT
jgi:hypothetical protein